MIENTLVMLGQPIVPYWRGGEVRAYSATDVGMVRDSNQDSFCANQGIGLYLVADGMGGRAGGEVASGLAVQAISWEVSQQLELLQKSDVTARRNILAKTINSASVKIYERSLELPQYRGMGTTCTLLWVPPATSNHQNVAILAHVGDSRCYLLRAGLFYQISDDHSLVNEQLKLGVLKRGDPMISQIRNVITRCVGYQEDEEVDTFALPLFQGDRFLLCSDGLTGKVADAEIADRLGSVNLVDAPKDLVELANQRGGDDNITVVVLEVS
jgi:protein phosphatase